MNKLNEKQHIDEKQQGNVKPRKALLNLREVKYQESPIERAIKLSSDEVIAMAIKSLVNKDRLN